MRARVVGAVVASVVVLSACSSTVESTDTSTPATSTESSSSPEAPSATPFVASPSPSPSATPEPAALSGDALRGALLTASDLGRGWKVTRRAQKPSKESKKEKEEVSEECLDFTAFLYGRPIAKDDPTSAFVEISRGKDFGAAWSH